MVLFLPAAWMEKPASHRPGGRHRVRQNRLNDIYFNSKLLMNKHTHPTPEHLDELADDARALMSATADVAGEKVAEARKCLANSLQRAKDICNRARDKAVQGAKATDQAIHDNPYKAIAIGVGIGALLGYIVANRCRSDHD